MGRVLSPALRQHEVRKEKQKVVPLSLAEERGGGGGGGVSASGLGLGFRWRWKLTELWLEKSYDDPPSLTDPSPL